MNRKLLDFAVIGIVPVVNAVLLAKGGYSYRKFSMSSSSGWKETEGVIVAYGVRSVKEEPLESDRMIATDKQDYFDAQIAYVYNAERPKDKPMCTYYGTQYSFENRYFNNKDAAEKHLEKVLDQLTPLRDSSPTVSDTTISSGSDQLTDSGSDGSHVPQIQSYSREIEQHLSTNDPHIQQVIPVYYRASKPSISVLQKPTTENRVRYGFDVAVGTIMPLGMLPVLRAVYSRCGKPGKLITLLWSGSVTGLGIYVARQLYDTALVKASKTVLEDYYKLRLPKK